MIDLTIHEALEKLKNGDISATELTRAYIDRIEKYGDELNCYITRTPERALADAAHRLPRPGVGVAEQEHAQPHDRQKEEG